MDEQAKFAIHAACRNGNRECRRLFPHDDPGQHLNNAFTSRTSAHEPFAVSTVQSLLNVCTRAPAPDLSLRKWEK